MVLKAGGFSAGGINFDAKLRRQSRDPEGLILGHAGAMDDCASGLKAAALLEDGTYGAQRGERNAGSDRPDAKAMLRSEPVCIATRVRAARVRAQGVNPEPRSGRQERRETLWNREL